MGNRSCCFFGFDCEEGDAVLVNRMKLAIRNLFDAGTTHFLFCGAGNFLDICYNIVSDLQKTNEEVKIIAYVCRDEWACIKSEAQEKKTLAREVFGVDINLKEYDKVVRFVRNASADGMISSQLNNTVIRESDTCVFYASESFFEEDYLKIYKDESNACKLLRLAYRYALRCNKPILKVIAR